MLCFLGENSLGIILYELMYMDWLEPNWLFSKVRKMLHCLVSDSLIEKNNICGTSTTGFPGGASGKEHSCQCRRHKRLEFDHWVGKIPWRRAWQPTPIFLPSESPWTEDPGELQSIESQRVGHDWRDLAHTHTLFWCKCCMYSSNKTHNILAFINFAF